MKLEVVNINKKFKGNIVLNNVNMTLETGNIYGFSGRNGSGKSILLKIISGLYLADSGDIILDNKKYDFKKEFLPSLGALIEEPKFFTGMSGYENLKFLSRIKNKIDDKTILKYLDIVNLIDEKDKKYSKYSLGMKQKLGISAALMEDDDIIILDEPFNGIEEQTVIKLKEYLKTIKSNKIIILSTHIKEDLEELSDVIYHFDNGNVRRENEV